MNDKENDLPDPPDNEAFNLFDERFQDLVDERMQRGTASTLDKNSSAAYAVQIAWQAAARRQREASRAFRPKLGDAMQNPRKKRASLREQREKR